MFVHRNSHPVIVIQIFRFEDTEGYLHWNILRNR